MIEYIPMNPVRKGFVDRATDWRWSSAQWYTHGTGPLELDQRPTEWTVGMSADSGTPSPGGFAVRGAPPPPSGLARGQLDRLVRPQWSSERALTGTDCKITITRDNLASASRAPLDIAAEQMQITFRYAAVVARPNVGAPIVFFRAEPNASILLRIDKQRMNRLRTVKVFFPAG